MHRIVLFLVLTCAAASAQEGQLGSDFRREGEEIRKNCTELKRMPACAQTVATGHPLKLSFGSIAPQNGFAFGPAFVYEKNAGESWRLNTNADAVFAPNGSWRTGLYLKALHTPSEVPLVVTSRPQGEPDFLEPAPVPEFNVYAQAISLKSLDYYGIGQFTSRGGLAHYAMREVITGGNVIYPLFGSSGLAAFGELNGRWFSLDADRANGLTPIRDRYGPGGAPGLERQRAYTQFGEGLRFLRAWAPLRLNYAATYQQFVSAGTSLYRFQRLTLDFDHEIPLYRHMKTAAPAESVGPDQSPASLESRPFSKNRWGAIGLRAFLVRSYTGANSVVPFYLQPTLGGLDINSSRMLPSYPDYRFRAPHAMLFRASIEHSIWGPVGAMFMADTGRVADRWADIGFEHMRHSYAAGLTIRAGGLPQVMLLLAWGGNEGRHTIAYINPFLLGSGGRPSLY